MINLLISYGTVPQAKCETQRAGESQVV